MIHHGEGLPFLLKAGDHLFGVHPRFEDLQGYPAAHRCFLLRDPDDAKTAFAELLHQLVGSDPVSCHLVLEAAKLLFQRCYRLAAPPHFTRSGG